MRYNELIEQITRDMADSNLTPWHCPWTRPKNIRGNRYRGFNLLILNFLTRDKDYKAKVYMTARQANELGGNIKKDEKGFPVCFYQPRRLEEVKDENGETWLEEKHGFLRCYTVFNVEQTENVNLPQNVLEEVKRNWEPLERADEIVLNYKDRPKIKASSAGGAFYVPSKDEVYLPPLKDFESVESFYSTAFHELCHSTGHEKRLNRKTLTASAAFGSKDYSLEELVAEIGSTMLLTECNLYNRLEQRQSAGYVKSWIARFKEKPALLWQSAAKAQKAVDWILGVKFEKENK